MKMMNLLNDYTDWLNTLEIRDSNNERIYRGSINEFVAKTVRRGNRWMRRMRNQQIMKFNTRSGELHILMPCAKLVYESM